MACKIEGKLTEFDLGEGNDFWFEVLEDLKNQGLEKSGWHGTLLQYLQYS